MRTLLTSIVLAVATTAVHAQGFSSGEIERSLRPGPYVPYDGAPYSHRYNFSTGPMLYFNYDSRNLWYLDYLDRADRAERFGYRPPTEPVFARPGYSGRSRFSVGGGLFFGR